MSAIEVCQDRGTTPGPWQVIQKKRGGMSGQLLSLAEIPYYITANGQPVGAAWNRTDAEFIVQAREDWPLLIRSFVELQGRLAERENECARLTKMVEERDAELDHLRPLSRDATTMLARILGIHQRKHDWALPWADICAFVEANGISDWRDWTKW